jgi:hypothetical protein
MPRTCLACSSPNRSAIDAAIASGEPLRNIAKRVSISPAGLLRHKAHVSVALAKIAEKREESIGESIMARLEKLYQRGERVLDEAERSGDGRLALQAIRETREVLAGVFALANKAAEANPSGNEIVWRVVTIGEAPIHEWAEVPASAVALPYREAGCHFYKCRKNVPQTAEERVESRLPRPFQLK